MKHECRNGKVIMRLIHIFETPVPIVDNDHNTQDAMSGSRNLGGAPANISVLAPRRGPLRLASAPQLFAALIRGPWR